MADKCAAIRRAGDRLPSDDRELTVLRVLARLSSEEVACVLPDATGAVRRLSHGRWPG